MKKIKVKGNILIINKKEVKFDFPILKAEEYKDFAIVLLNAESAGLCYELYSVSDSGKIRWKMEDASKLLCGSEPQPTNDFMILDGSIVAFDSDSRKFIVDEKDGNIIDHHFGEW